MLTFTSSEGHVLTRRLGYFTFGMMSLWIKCNVLGYMTITDESMSPYL